jgi:hypothetical protein
MINVIDNLDSTSAKNALSANMGRILNEAIEALKLRVTTLEGTTLDISSMSSEEIQEIIE